MTRDEVRAIVIELLKELTAGTISNKPERDADGEEFNNYVFDGEAFVDRIFTFDDKPDTSALDHSPN